MAMESEPVFDAPGIEPWALKELASGDGCGGGTEPAVKPKALTRVGSMPTPCRTRNLSSSHLQELDANFPQAQRRPSESSSASWQIPKLVKEGFSPTPSTGPSTASSPAPSWRASQFSQTMPSKVRRPSRTVSRSSSEALLGNKEPGDEVEGLEEAFWKLCSANREGLGIDCRLFDKLCKDAGFLDTKFTTADADLIFTSVTCRGPRRLDVQHFDSALRLLADRKCLPVEVVFHKMKSLAAPPKDFLSFGKADSRSSPSPSPGPRVPGASPPPPTPPLRKTPSLMLLETPPRHRLFASPTLSGGSALVQPQTQQQKSSKPHSATRNNSSERGWGRSGSLGGRLKPLEGSHGLGGTRTSEQAQRELLLDTFASFCWGKTDMDGRGFARLCRDCRLIDSRFTALDADLLFTKVLPKGQRRLDIESFDAALKIISDRKNMTEGTVIRAIAFCHGPQVRATQAGEVRLHDDRGGYTGTWVLGGPESGALGLGTVASIW